MHLEAQVICLITLHDLMHQAHKGLLMDEEFGTLLVLMYLTESHCPWPVALGSLHNTPSELLAGAFLLMVGLVWPAFSPSPGPIAAPITWQAPLVREVCSLRMPLAGDPSSYPHSVSPLF